MLPESAPCSQFPYDYSLDNMALHYAKFALQVAAKIASRSWALIFTSRYENRLSILSNDTKQ